MPCYRSIRAVFIAGEVFFRFRPRRLEDGLSVPLQLQMIPSEMLPLTRTEIRSRHGYFLAIPTPAAGKHGDGRKKIAPGGWERRHGAKLRFVFRRGGPSLLVAENQRARAGKRGGFGKASETALRTGHGLATVPMFILVPQITVRKRLDVAGAADRWIAELPRLVIQNWREPGRG